MKPLPAFHSIHTIAFDFDGVFTDNKVYLNQEGMETVMCDRSDGLAMDMLRSLVREQLLKCEIFILSTESNPVVSFRAKKLKIGCYQGIDNKRDALSRLFCERGLREDVAFSGLLFFGNDLNDMGVIDKPCYSVVPRDAHPFVKEKASLTVARDGGDGFVRTFVESWLEANHISKEKIYELISHR